MAQTVLILFFTLIALIVLLIFMYKKLNREANGEYTIRRMVYKEGGARDQMRSAVFALETRLGIQLLPRSDEEGAEMESVEEGPGGSVEDVSNQGSDTDGEDKEDEVEEDSTDQSNNPKDKSDDDSSLESGDQERLIDEPEVKDETGEKREEKQEKVEVEQGKADASGGTGLLIDLKQFSGSAIWSEEEKGEGRSGDVTAL